jgi:hypothetical protein
MPPTDSTVDRSYLVTDTSVTLDAYAFYSAACDEVIPEGSGNAARPEPGQGIALTVVATSCWQASVQVTNSNGVVVDSFSQTFGIWNRKDGDKERGEVGYLVWTGHQGDSVAPHGTYVWHIRFDFGQSRILPLRALIDW